MLFICYFIYLFVYLFIYFLICSDTFHPLSGCLPKILRTQIGPHKINLLQILHVNCTRSSYIENTFRLGSKRCLLQFPAGGGGGGGGPFLSQN